jgi:hypothetical protein
MNEASEFRLSRIYAEGWNAANKIPSKTLDSFNPARIATLNPYRVETEKARWSEGFRKSLERWSS